MTRPPDRPANEGRPRVPNSRQALASFATAEEASRAIATGTRTAVIVPVIKERRENAGGRDQSARGKASAQMSPTRDPETRLEEAKGLARAIDLNIVESAVVAVASARPATLVGTGKLEELKGLFRALEIDLVIVDHPLTPGQQRNLEKAWELKVLDRTGLILEIFGRRARTREGRLQVELAHLSYQKSRLVRSWTHLERQRGGLGSVGGPGETQMEADRRQIQDRIDAIRGELEVVTRTRSLHREGRKRVPYPVVALVGYTNAGKSTLFNRLSGAQVVARDQLFATLDPTMREVVLKSGRRVILSDTVGFISDLPTMLIAAFRATLEEVVGADLILHVRDIADPHSQAQRMDVERVLGEIGIAGEAFTDRSIEIWNKIDLCSPERASELRAGAVRIIDNPPVVVSAASGEGIDDLLRALDARLGQGETTVELDVAAGEGGFINWLHERTEIVDRREGEEGRMVFVVRLDAAKRGQLDHRISAFVAGTVRIIAG